MAESIAQYNSRQDSSVGEAAKAKDDTPTDVPKGPSPGKKIWDKLGLNVGMLMLMVK